MVPTGNEPRPYVLHKVDEAVTSLTLFGKLNGTVQKLRVFLGGFFREKFDG
jgi:hypothetical protein